MAFDPLDGSSIVDTNFTVGTIFGVWPGAELTNVTGRQQVAAAMGVYGPRTTYVLTINGFPGTHEFLLMDDGEHSMAQRVVCNPVANEGAADDEGEGGSFAGSNREVNVAV